jgi:hypothetical protein
MSFMLLGMPQNKNKAVTKMKGRALPGEKSLGSSFAFCSRLTRYPREVLMSALAFPADCPPDLWQGCALDGGRRELTPLPAPALPAFPFQVLSVEYVFL